MTLVSPGGVDNAANLNLVSDRSLDRPIGRILASATQSIPNNANTAIAFAAEDYDTHATHDIVTNNSRIFVPTGYAGYYEFKGSVPFGARTDYSVVDAFFRKNGTTIIPPGNRRTLATTISGFQAVSSACRIFMDPAAGDYMELMAFQVNVAAVAQVTAFSAPLVAVCEWEFTRR